MAYSDKSINLTVYRLRYPIESPERPVGSEVIGGRFVTMLLPKLLLIIDIYNRDVIVILILPFLSVLSL